MACRFVFLLCSERSGSNLLTRMMDAHPDVSGPPPSHLVRTFSQNLLRYGDLQSENNWVELTDDMAQLLSTQLGAWQSQITGTSIRAASTTQTLHHAIRAVYETEAQLSGANIVFLKENRAWRLLPFLAATFNDAQFVLLTRDPRDMALSWKRSANHPGGIVEAATTWQEDQQQSLIAHAAFAISGRMALLRYEDLVADSESTLTKLCGELGITFEQRMLEFHQKQTTIENAARIANWENLAKPVLSNNTAKWSGILSDKEVLYIESRCHQEMEALGYQCSNNDLESNLAIIEPLIDESMKHPVATPHKLSEAEQNIREMRLAVLNRIIERPIKSVVTTS